MMDEQIFVEWNAEIEKKIGELKKKISWHYNHETNNTGKVCKYRTEIERLRDYILI